MNAIRFLKRTDKPETKPVLIKQHRPERKDFSYYVQMFDHETGQPLGHLADISPGGFKLDSPEPIPPDTDLQFHLELTSEMADKPFMVFVARSKWCQIDPLDPFCYNIGFQLIGISPEDLQIYNRMIEKYGRTHEDRTFDLRRSNKW